MTQGVVRVIVNPISGRGHDREFVPELVRHLALRGFRPEVCVTERSGHARKLAGAVSDKARCVVSVGGDGTHREVLAGLLGRPVPACIVPTGTENVLGQTFGFSGTIHSVVDRIQNGRAAAIDMGVAGGHPFVMFSGIGFDAFVTRQVNENRRGAIHREAYYGPIVRSLLRYKFPVMAVTVDGRLLADDVGYILVGNTPLYADHLRIAARAVADDGLLDVVCFRTQSRWHFLRLYLAARGGRHLDHPDVAYGQGSHIEVRSCDGPVPVQTDGDAITETPITYTVRHQAVRLLVRPETPHT
jgi:YegS/Rv2252/BmrU family lipid kinase